MTDKNLQFNQEMCERYLLGDLPEHERDQFEDAYFADDALFEQFLAYKDELLDAYARGELSEEKQKRVEKHFSATAPRQRQINETKNFIGAITTVSTSAVDVKEPLSVRVPKSSWRRTLSNLLSSRTVAWQGALAVILLLALGGIWIFVRRSQQPLGDEQAIQKPTPAPTSRTANNNYTNENNNISSPSPTPANVNQSAVNQDVSPTPTPKPVERPPKISTAQIASVLLMPVTSRDINESNTLRLSSDTQVARASVVFKDDNFRNYSAAITTIEGAVVWERKRLKTNRNGANKSVTLLLPPAVLRGQDYIIVLKGETASGQIETINEYYFRVVRNSSQNLPKATPQS